MIPISARQSTNTSHWVSSFTLPGQRAVNTLPAGSIPLNTRRAVFSVSANGQASEEFWWSAVPQSGVYTFNETAGPLTGWSPFREVQVLIDGQLAGVQWPFPVIFTGGVVPSLHRPVAGVDAFDLKEGEVDITPFLGRLCDGGEHTFEVRVVGLDDTSGGEPRLTETVGENWVVTGKIFVWLSGEDGEEGDADADGVKTTTGDKQVTVAAGGRDPQVINISRRVTQSRNNNGTTLNETLVYETVVRRELRISAKVKVSGGAEKEVTWTQSLSYSNKGEITAFGFDQINDMLISGHDSATTSGDNGPYYETNYNYPLYVNSTYTQSELGNLTIVGHVIQRKEVERSGQGVYPSGLEAFSPSRGGKFIRSALVTRKEGTARFDQTGDGRSSSGFGTTTQSFRLRGDSLPYPEAEDVFVETLYNRNVEAVNGTITSDVKTVFGPYLAQEMEVAESSGAAVQGGQVFAEVHKGDINQMKIPARMFMRRSGHIRH